MAKHKNIVRIGGVSPSRTRIPRSSSAIRSGNLTHSAAHPGSQRRLGLYIHIPFCRKKCSYCDFYSLSCGESSDFDTLSERYTTVLERHLTETAKLTTSPVDTVYFGGGTPTVLSTRQLTRLLSVIKKRFKLLPGAEITVEANPESALPKTLKALRRAGFNRISLGVQSLSDHELERLGRIHDSDTAKHAFQSARDAGFKNISIDLMFGIEDQTPESWRDTLRRAIELHPEHISCYGLRVEDGTPLALRASTANLADDDTQADMYLDACDVLADAGYRHYEISNWAQPGMESRHNLRYWRLEPYIGFGPAAHSDCFGARYSNVRDIESYMRGIELGGAVLDEYEDIEESERAFEYVMLSLRTTDGVDLDSLSKRFSAPPGDARELMRSLTQQELASYEGGGRWCLTERGWLISNSIILKVIDAMSGSDRPQNMNS